MANGPTVLDKQAFAVMWSPKNGYEIKIPKMPSDTMVPDPALALMGAFARLTDDPEFALECAEYFKDENRKRRQ